MVHPPGFNELVILDILVKTGINTPMIHIP